MSLAPAGHRAPGLRCAVPGRRATTRTGLRRLRCVCGRTVGVCQEHGRGVRKACLPCFLSSTPDHDVHWQWPPAELGPRRGRRTRGRTAPSLDGDSAFLHCRSWQLPLGAAPRLQCRALGRAQGAPLVTRQPQVPHAIGMDGGRKGVAAAARCYRHGPPPRMPEHLRRGGRRSEKQRAAATGAGVRPRKRRRHDHQLGVGVKRGDNHGQAGR